MKIGFYFFMGLLTNQGKTMEKRIVILAILTICVHLTCADITTIQCCTCSSMMPIGVQNTQPQVYPSPFKIKVDPKELEYSARGRDINGKRHRKSSASFGATFFLE